MKKDKDKCKKSKESTIGKIIYGFLLFLPLMAISVTCAYAIFNKNAYESYQDYQTQTIVTIPQTDNLQEGRTYTITYTSGLTVGQNFYVQNGKTNIVNLYFPNENWTVNYFTPSYEGNRTRLIIHDTNGTQHNKFTWQDIENNFWFVSTGNNSTNTTNNYAYKITTLEATQGKLDNVFYYSIDKVTENPLFNWAGNSIIYTGMNEFTTSLSITNTFIPLLLTYWLIISLVYFIYDIVLIIFNVLHRKIHELQDSI